MSDTRPLPAGTETHVTVRYWAAARAAAGTSADTVPVGEGGATLAEVTERAVAARAGAPGSDRLAAVLAACSVLIGEQPVGRRDPATVVVPPGASVEFLPPFAGG